MGSVKPFPQARDPVVVMATGRVDVWLVVVIIVVSQQVGMEVTEEEPSFWCVGALNCVM